MEDGTPLADVTFVVFDLETTAMSPATGAITEVGAAKFRRGELLGTLSTVVDPGCGIPPFVSLLTGITEVMVAAAPPISAVLPSFVEFAAGGVLVGHNVRFDLAFMDAALSATGRGPCAQPSVDTLRLSRRMLVDEVPNHRLHTLARHFATPNQPSHRALPDALATADLLHTLLDRGGCCGLTTLGALLEMAGVDRDEAGTALPDGPRAVDGELPPDAAADAA